MDYFFFMSLKMIFYLPYSYLKVMCYSWANGTTEQPSTFH